MIPFEFQIILKITSGNIIAVKYQYFHNFLTEIKKVSGFAGYYACGGLTLAAFSLSILSGPI